MSLVNIGKTITLDVYDHDTTPSVIKAIQMDTGTRTVFATIQNSRQEYDIGQNATVSLTVLRPDKTKVQITGETFVSYTGADGTMYGAKAELSDVALAVKGDLKAQFKITSGEQELRTEIFAINNGEALDAGDGDWAGDLDGHNLDEMAESIETLQTDVATVNEDVSELKSGFSEITEDYGTDEETITVDVSLDLSDIRAGARTADQVGQSMNISTSSVTTALVRVFACEAGKTYTLTITNGATPAQIADRATVVITDLATSSATILEVFRSTNTASAQDVIEFTPTVSGYVYFNVDKNYQSVSVTTTETHVTTENTAVDKQARADISALQSTTATLSANVGQLSSNVESFGEIVNGVEEDVSNITETYQDGTVETEITLDLSYIRTNKRANGTLNQTVSLDNEHNTGFNNSSVTTCVARCFECEADKTYTVTIINGATPASVAERDTVVVVVPIEGLYSGRVNYVYKTTNSSASTDIVTFTSPVAGYVFLNLDANYQSVSVAELQDRIVTTAVDVKARNTVEGVSKYILNGNIQKEVAFESGTFDASLTDVLGSGYRSNVISGVSGCAVCIKVDPSYAFIYGDGINPLMTIYGIYVIHPSTDTIRIGLSDTPENVGFEMRIYTERGHKGKYDVVVAASNSSAEDKAKADIVCDGTNDELDLQFAANWNFWRKNITNSGDRCNVLLMPGTYNIDSFTQQYSADGQLMRNKYAVVIGNNPYNNYQFYRYRVSIEGAYNSEHNSSPSTWIKVSDTAKSLLSSEINNVVLGLALSADGTTGAFRSNNLSMCLKNLFIHTNGIPNKIIAIDAYQAGNTVIKDCDVWSTVSTAYLPSSTIETEPEGSIGIRAGRGSCLGVRQRIEGCRIIGFHEGIALCGEHFIVQDCAEIACYYGFTLNNYTTGGAVQHPNVFIGNSVEQCLNMAKFVESGNNATIIYIGGSVENKLTQDSPATPMKPIEIAQTTQFRGRIESDGLATPYKNSLFYEGYGSTFEQTIYPFWQA